MDPLPFVDDHVQRLGRPPEAAWDAMLRVLRHDMRASARVARLLGCEPSEGTPEFGGRPGETVPGFRIVAAERGRLLALRGRHRFAEYALTFLIEGESLHARTHAAFPGLCGKLYRAAVITSGGHRLVTRRLLRRIASV